MNDHEKKMLIASLIMTGVYEELKRAFKEHAEITDANKTFQREKEWAEWIHTLEAISNEARNEFKRHRLALAVEKTKKTSKSYRQKGVKK